MLKTLSRTAAVATLACLPFAASALGTPVTYDFKAAADSVQGDNASLVKLGESAYSVFDTSVPWGGLGPHLEVTAKRNGSDAFVYFDANNAGMGVCGELNTDTGGTSGTGTGARPGNIDNICDPSNDDGIDAGEAEILTFTALSDLYVASIAVNSNHDNSNAANVSHTEWTIDGTDYDFTPAVVGDVDFTIDLGNFIVRTGETFDIVLTAGPNSYISSMTVGAVPLPAAAWLLLGVSGALVAAKRRSARRDA